MVFEVNRSAIKYIPQNRAATAGQASKASKAWASQYFGFQYALIRNNPVKKF
jgi:hypothetical protein